ncbi:hypothetical protein ZIOFF_050648 [Zingiber officinale]|uniref:BHLH domain-containing protein n=1 Tax=Zingiber officinale TaxID=94328 RepID=A0A8J5KQI9_ZINOF|nr:hypothetical protein ZIOFF_050648 [Zingiber officinale]
MVHSGNGEAYIKLPSNGRRFAKAKGSVAFPPQLFLNCNSKCNSSSPHFTHLSLPPPLPCSRSMAGDQGSMDFDYFGSSQMDLQMAMMQEVMPPSISLQQSPPPSSFAIGLPNYQDQFLPPLAVGGGVPSVAAMREMIFHMAAMQPIHIDPESVRPPKRRNVRISTEPQSVAARHRRERISERIRILQQMVPGGTKMDTASMLDEAIHYMKFLKGQVQALEQAAASSSTNRTTTAVSEFSGAGYNGYFDWPPPGYSTSSEAWDQAATHRL